MKINPYKSPPPQQQKPLPTAAPDLEVVTLKDHFVQSAVGATACAIPAGLGFLGATAGQAVAGLPGALVGGALGVVAASLGTYYGLGAVPANEPEYHQRVQKHTAVRAGLLAAAGALGGPYAVGASALGGALFSGRVLDIAEGLMAYAPQPASSHRPDWLEERTITTADGKKLQAWFSPEPKEAPVCIFFHSNATNLEDNLGRLDKLRQSGVRVLAVEYRGFAGSDGLLSERGVRQDAKAAYAEALKETTSNKILIMGQSIGGAVAAGLASEVECAGLILESSFTSMSGMAGQMGEWAAMLTRGRYPVIDQVRDLKVPVLVAHGGWDSMVPVEMGRNLAQRNSQVTYLEVPQASHMDVYQDASFDASLKDFVKKVSA